MSQEMNIFKDSQRNRKIELVIQQLNTLPTLPAVAARLLQITSKPDTQAQEVVELIESDPSLTSKIIALTTRASVGVSRNSATLSKAVVLLGFDALRNAVLSIKVFETLNKKKPSDGEEEVFDRVGFWKHSLAVACASKMLIKLINRKIDSEEAFICGLLHDLGKIALDTCLPKSFARVVQLTDKSLGDIAEVERKIIGLDHCVVGRRLAEKWELPSSISEVVWLHHQWVHGLPEMVKHPEIVQSVHLADILARQQKIGYSGNYYLPHSAVKVGKELGCTAEDIEKVARELPRLVSDRAAILGLDSIEPMELYYEALEEANIELGRLNTRMQVQNNRLNMRSEYFDVLGRMGSSLRPGQSVVDVCSLVTKVWQSHIKCRRCSAYALADDECIIEGAVKVEPEIDPTVYLVDRNDDPDLDGSDQIRSSIPTGFAVVPVEESHTWFFKQVAPMFESNSTLLMPLRVGNDLVGAVLWEDEKSPSFYQEQLKEMQAFTAYSALMIRQSQKQEQQKVLCEQLVQSNTLLQNVQQELLQRRSLAAVGEMACGAAHEINNPLAIIVGRSQYLAGHEKESQKKEILEAIARNGQEISRIITELMEFARPTPSKPTSMSVPRLLEQMNQYLNDIMDKAGGIVIDSRIDDDLPDVFVDGGQIGRALAEIVANGIESYMPEEEGVVILKARYNDIDDEVIIDVEDKGCGMDEETLEKAVMPFFSGKKAGRKRGLGLSRGMRNIESNGGRIKLESKAGEGSCVRIILPVSRVPAASKVVVS
ncbi:MAG: HDOD domain-containing protein [Sedimentisphaerales bacterium]|nr:HDOD domain-containing protein [Sedimentisphaerales bacterium]